MLKLIIVLLVNASLLAQISASRLPRWAVFDSTDQISVTTDTLQVLTRSYLYGKTIVKGLAFDLHYQIDSFGSRQEFIK